MPLSFARLKRQPTWSAVQLGAAPCAVRVEVPLRTGKPPRVLACLEPKALLSSRDYVGEENILDPQVQSFLSGGASVTLLLDRKDYRLSVIPRPPVPDAELDSALRWSVAPLLDVPVEEVMMQALDIPTRIDLPDRPEFMYVVTATRQRLTEIWSPYEQARTPLRAVDIPQMAQRNLAALFAAPQEALGLVLHDAEGFSLCFVRDGELYLDRYVEAPMASLVGGEESQSMALVGRVAEEVARSLIWFERQMPFFTPQRLLVAPLLAPLPLVEVLQARVQLEVEAIDLERVFDLSEVPELMIPDCQARACLALGAALRGRG